MPFHVSAKIDQGPQQHGVSRRGGNPAVPAEHEKMKTNKGLKAMALALAVTLVAGTAVAGEGDGGNWKAADTLVGAWKVTVTPYRCDTGQEFPQFSFRSFLTFAAGGTMLETGSNRNFQPGQRSVGHGYWERTGPNDYHAVIEAFVYFDTSPPATPPAPNYQRGSQRLEQGIQMVSGDSWVSLAAVTFFDTGGTVVSTGCAKSEAERMR